MHNYKLPNNTPLHKSYLIRNSIQTHQPQYQWVKLATITWILLALLPTKSANTGRSLPVFGEPLGWGDLCSPSGPLPCSAPTRHCRLFLPGPVIQTKQPKPWCSLKKWRSLCWPLLGEPRSRLLGPISYMIFNETGLYGITQSSVSPRNPDMLLWA